MTDTEVTQDLSPGAVEERLVSRIERGLGWLLTEGAQHDLSIERLSANLDRLWMQMSDECILGLAYGDNRDADGDAGFWAVHKRVCTAPASTNRWSGGTTHTSEEMPDCWAVQHGFDLDEATADALGGRREGWEMLANLWRGALRPLCDGVEAK